VWNDNSTQFIKIREKRWYRSFSQSIDDQGALTKHPTSLKQAKRSHWLLAHQHFGLNAACHRRINWRIRGEDSALEFITRSRSLQGSRSLGMQMFSTRIAGSKTLHKIVKFCKFPHLKFSSFSLHKDQIKGSNIWIPNPTGCGPVPQHCVLFLSSFDNTLLDGFFQCSGSVTFWYSDLYRVPLTNGSVSGRPKNLRIRVRKIGIYPLVSASIFNTA